MSQVRPLEGLELAMELHGWLLREVEPMLHTWDRFDLGPQPPPSRCIPGTREVLEAFEDEEPFVLEIFDLAGNAAVYTFTLEQEQHILLDLLKRHQRREGGA